MNVLVINCGSSSLKYQLINSDSEEVLAKGLCERIGIDGRLVYQKEGLDKEITEAPMPTHKEAIQMVLDALVNPKTGAVKSLAEIDAVGHRVVHGGEKFSDSVVITEEVIAQVEECNDLAPLHNPANIIGIRACQALMPNVPKLVGVFDTAFPSRQSPEKSISSTAEESNEVDLGTPGLHVETLEGVLLPFNAQQQGSTLRVTSNTLAARLHGTRQALEALREQGVEQIQFVTSLKTTTLSVEDLLAEGGSWFALEHDGLGSRRLSAAQAESLKCWRH